MNAHLPDGPDGAIDEIDLAALDGIRAVFDQLDPVPDGMADRVRFALTMHALEAEVAELIQPERDLVTLSRRDEVARAESVTFTSSSLNVMVTISVIDTDHARVDGWTTVHGAGVRLHLDSSTDPGAEAGAEDLVEIADDSGRFAFSSVSRGSARLVVTPPADGARPVLTPPFDI